MSNDRALVVIHMEVSWTWPVLLLLKLLHRHQVNTAVFIELAEVIVPNAAINYVASSQCPVKISALWGFDVKDKEDPVMLC